MQLVHETGRKLRAAVVGPRVLHQQRDSPVEIGMGESGPQHLPEIETTLHQAVVASLIVDPQRVGFQIFDREGHSETIRPNGPGWVVQSDLPHLRTCVLILPHKEGRGNREQGTEKNGNNSHCHFRSVRRERSEESSRSTKERRLSPKAVVPGRLRSLFNPSPVSPQALRPCLSLKGRGGDFSKSVSPPCERSERTREGDRGWAGEQ